MWVRGTRLRAAPDKVDALIDEFVKQTVPQLKQIPGNAGSVLLVNRQAGDCVALTYWRDRAALDGSETAATGLRNTTAQKSGATVAEVQRYEVALMERTGPPEPGHFVRVVRFSGDAARADEGLTFLRSTVLPQLKSINGFRALICGIDRANGLGIISTVWNTLADLNASDAKIAQVRQDAVGRFGARDVTIDVYEGVYVELAATAVV
jgi:heme-degrading monooxygenase HmoA